MRIGIDARELSGHSTGVGRYLAGLLGEWATATYARRHDFVLYSHEPLALPLDARRFPTHVVKGRAGTLWEQLSLPAVAAKDHLDVFFAPAYTAPVVPHVRSVVAIHDLSFVAHPEWFTTREGVRRRWLTRRTAARAAAVITISQFSRRELIERLNVPDSRIHVIPPGITPIDSVPGAAEAPDAAPNVLFVGSIFRRRHVPDLIRAIALLGKRRPDVSLDLVGDNRTFPKEDIQRAMAVAGVEGRARWHRYVSDEALAALYGRARAFAFLSDYEGLGLTPLEALQHAVPPVLLDTPVARESCGDAAIYVRSPSIADMAAALETALFDQAARGRVLGAVPSVLARYSWPRAAKDTMAVIESA
jgi:glycosyltransferase involved in cell wall biosynthesis